MPKVSEATPYKKVTAIRKITQGNWWGSFWAVRGGWRFTWANDWEIFENDVPEDPGTGVSDYDLTVLKT